MKSLNRHNKNIVGYYIIGACAVVFAFLSISALSMRGEEYDPETFCLSELTAHTVVVLDKTDGYSITQQEFVLNYINKEKDELKQFEKFSVFALTENSSSNPEPIFSKCNPGTGKNANQLYQNPRKIQMRFDEFFSEPLANDLDGILGRGSSSKSPILEMIRELSLRDDFGDEVEDRTLLIISDLMQHTFGYSHYRNKIDYNFFSKSSYAYDVTASLNGVKVKILYLLRNKLRKVQGKHHLSFWEEYFQGMGAVVTEIKMAK